MPGALPQYLIDCPGAMKSSFEAPDDVSLEGLNSVKLGEGVAFGVQPN